MDADTSRVLEKVAQGDAWYVGSQRAWADSPRMKYIYAARREFFIRVAGSRRGGGRFLDVGCGDGYWSRFFAERGFAVCGVDYNPLRIARAVAGAPGCRFIEGDVTRHMPELGTFDIVFCSQVIEHIADDVGFLKTLGAYIVAGGCLILGTTNEGCLTQRLRNRFRPVGSDHVHAYREREIRGKISAAGCVSAKRSGK